MPGYKVTFFFEGLQQADVGAGAAVGWTESWGISVDAPGIDAVFTHPDIARYIDLRTGCMSALYRMSFLRVSSIPVAGVTPTRLVKVGSLQDRIGAIDPGVGGGSQVQCAVLADLQRLPRVGGEKVHHRKFLLRGLPSDVIKGNVINPFGANWLKIRNFLDFVANKPTLGARTKVDPAAALGITYQDEVTAPKTPLPELAVNGNSPLVIQLMTTLDTTVAGTQYRVSGLRGIGGSYLNRVWNLIVQANGPPAIATLGTSRLPMPATSIAFPNEGKLQKIRFAIGTLDQYAIIGLRSKRTGRVFHQLRGRSSNRVRR